MRTRKIMVISAVFAVLLIAFAVMAFSEPERLSISVGPVSYKAYRQIVASFALTNTSKVAIEYSKLNRARLRVLGERGWRDYQWTGTQYSAPKVVDPGGVTSHQVVLPLDVRRWQIGYEAQTPSAQMQLWRKLPRNFATRVWGTVSRIVPSEPGEAELVWSNEIDAQGWRETHPDELAEAARAPHRINSGKRDVWWAR